MEYEGQRHRFVNFPGILQASRQLDHDVAESIEATISLEIWYWPQ